MNCTESNSKREIIREGEMIEQERDAQRTRADALESRVTSLEAERDAQRVRADSMEAARNTAQAERDARPEQCELDDAVARAGRLEAQRNRTRTARNVSLAVAAILLIATVILSFVAFTGTEDEQIAELERQLESRPTADQLASAKSDANKAEEKVEELEEQIEELEDRPTADQLASAKSDADKAEEKVEELEEKLEELESRPTADQLASAQAEIDRLKEENARLASVSRTTPPVNRTPPSPSSTSDDGSIGDVASFLGDPGSGSVSQQAQGKNTAVIYSLKPGELNGKRVYLPNFEEKRAIYASKGAALPNFDFRCEKPEEIRAWVSDKAVPGHPDQFFVVFVPANG